MEINGDDWRFCGLGGESRHGEAPFLPWHYEIHFAPVDSYPSRFRDLVALHSLAGKLAHRALLQKQEKMRLSVRQAVHVF